MNPYWFKNSECFLHVLKNCFCSMICFFRIPQTRIAIFPLLAYGSHIMLKVLFYQCFFSFLFFQLLTPVGRLAIDIEVKFPSQSDTVVSQVIMRSTYVRCALPQAKDIQMFALWMKLHNLHGCISKRRFFRLNVGEPCSYMSDVTWVTE